jgi:hypothetical protein
MNETIGHISVLVDNANAENAAKELIVRELWSYVCKNISPVNPHLHDMMDIINGKTRTDEEKREDGLTTLSKYIESRNYCIRLREVAEEDDDLAGELNDRDLWPPPHTEPEDIT